MSNVSRKGKKPKGVHYGIKIHTHPLPIHSICLWVVEWACSISKGGGIRNRRRR